MDREKLKEMIERLPYCDAQVKYGKYTIRRDSEDYTEWDDVEIVEHDTTEATDWIDGPIKLDNEGIEYILNTITKNAPNGAIREG